MDRIPAAVDDSRPGIDGMARRHGHGDEQQARQRARGAGDRREELPVLTEYHGANRPGWLA
jgi:hypothetical protein